VNIDMPRAASESTSLVVTSYLFLLRSVARRLKVELSEAYCRPQSSGRAGSALHPGGHAIVVDSQ
jgi:hypothetical protein